MRLDQLMSREDWADIIVRFTEPQGGPPWQKGEDAIMVHGYLVKGHWRKRNPYFTRAANNGRRRGRKPKQVEATTPALAPPKVEK